MCDKTCEIIKYDCYCKNKITCVDYRKKSIKCTERVRIIVVISHNDESISNGWHENIG